MYAIGVKAYSLFIPNLQTLGNQSVNKYSLLYKVRRITSPTLIRGNILCYYRTCTNDGTFPNCNRVADNCIHPNENIIFDMNLANSESPTLSSWVKVVGKNLSACCYRSIIAYIHFVGSHCVNLNSTINQCSTFYIHPPDRPRTSL